MRIGFRDLPIGAKLTWIATIASVTALVTAGLVLAVHEDRYFRQSLERRLHIHAEIIALNSASALLFRDEGSAASTLGALRASANVLGAAVYDEQGRLFASFSTPGRDFSAPPTFAEQGPSERFEGDGVVVVDPIVFDDRRIGAILLRASLAEMHGRRREFALVLLVVSAVAFTIALLISRGYQRAIARPVQALAATAHKVSQEQDYSVRAEAGGRDEVGQLVDAFNAMLAQIQQRDGQLAQAMQGLERRVEERTRDLQRELEERRRAEDEILRLNGQNEERLAELTVLNREIEAFSYSVSHDLRAPLRHISGFVEMLKARSEASLDEKSRRYLSVIAEGASRMGRLIDDLLSFSRTSRTELVESRVELRALVDDVIAEIMRDAGGRRVEWAVGRLPVVTGDRAMLRIVLVNLLGNAFKYTGKSEAPRVEVGTQPADDGRVVVFVRDNGVGFDMAYADKLFGVFQRLHRAEEFEGTGIGLATVQRIVHRHGGRVWAESTPGSGATFFMSLRAAEESN